MIFSDPTLIDNPYPHYQTWRDERPIWWGEDIKAWVLSRHEDVRYVLKNAALFSSNSMGEMDHQTIALPLLTDDPPRHTQLRTIVSTAFTSRTLRKMEAEIEVLVEQLLDNMAGQSRVDITADFSVPLPVSLISRLMGIPEERYEDFKRWSDALVSTGPDKDIKDRMPDIMEMGAYFRSLIIARREEPGDDLVTRGMKRQVTCFQIYSTMSLIIPRFGRPCEKTRIRLMRLLRKPCALTRPYNGRTAKRPPILNFMAKQ